MITRKVNEPFLGVILEYEQDRTLPGRIELPQPSSGTSRDARPAEPAGIRLGVLGAGNFANSTSCRRSGKSLGSHPWRSRRVRD